MVRSFRIAPILSRSYPFIACAFVAGCGASEEALPLGTLSVADVGFLSPRAVVHDAVADIYLVSNVNGPATAEDQNGFVSRVTPDGVVESLTWLAPTGPGSALHAPAGMGIRGDSIFIADLKCIVFFHRVSGEGIERRCLDDASLLSGLDIGPEGSLFVTDSGYEGGAGGMTSSGTAAVYRLVIEDQRRGSTLAQGADLGHPMSVAVGSRGIFVVTSDPGYVIRLTGDGQRTDVISVPNGSFQGVVFTADGGFAYSSASDSTIYHVDGQGAVHTVLTGVDSPGDLGYDATRNRLLVPLTNENRILFLDL
jgi:hypothetical protein